MSNTRSAIRTVAATAALALSAVWSPLSVQADHQVDRDLRRVWNARPRVVSSSVQLNPSGYAPLAAVVQVTTDLPTRVRLTLLDERRRWTVESGDAYQTSHNIVVLGLKPDTHHSIDVRVESADGRYRHGNRLAVTTDRLPADFPPISVDSDPRRVARGFTFFAVAKWPGARDPLYGLVVAVDVTGEIVWYYKTDLHAADDVRRLRNGNIMITDLGNLAGQAVEIDMLGNIVQSWRPRLRPSNLPNSTFVDIDTLHHDMVELPNGHFLTLSSELRLVNDFPTLDPGRPTETANVVGDVVVEFRRDGSIVNEWKMFDMLDLHRIGYQSVLGFWNAAYGNPTGGTRAWTWGNAVSYVAEDDSILISLRHQNAVMKFSRASGAIKWIFGDHSGWGPTFQQYLLTPATGATWPYGQHGAKITRRGTLLLHDNGNFRAMPPDAPTPAAENFSRGVEYRIDEGRMKVDQVWEFGGNQYYAMFVGDADLLQRNNVLVTFGGQAKVNGVPVDGAGHLSAQILEIDRRRKRSDIVMEIRVSDPATSYSVYRSQKMSSLYR